MAEYRIRSVGTGILPASDFLANSDNWRIHPRPQQEAVDGALDEVGWVERVIVNVRSGEEWGESQGVQTLVDGHLRVTLALRRGDNTPVPVEFVDLNPAEEALILASLDPTGSMARSDRDKLALLLDSVQSDQPALQAMLEGLAVKEGLIKPVDFEAEWQGMPEFVQEDVEKEYHTIKVHFANAEDLAAFEKLVGQTVTIKSKYIWYPKKEALDLTKFRVVDDES